MTSSCEYNGRPAYPVPGLPCWHFVSGIESEHGEDIALQFALFDDAGGQVRAEVHCLRHGGDVAQLWRRGAPEILLWSREYRRSAPGWFPYRDVLAEAVRITGRPLPGPLREHVERIEAESSAP